MIAATNEEMTCLAMKQGPDAGSNRAWAVGPSDTGRGVGRPNLIGRSHYRSRSDLDRDGLAGRPIANEAKEGEPEPHHRPCREFRDGGAY